MDPLNKQQQPSNQCPTTYDEYLGLCRRRSIDPQLDQPLFDAVVEELSPRRDAAGGGEQACNRETIARVEGLSEEELLQRLGASLHLDNLLNPPKKA